MDKKPGAMSRVLIATVIVAMVSGYGAAYMAMLDPLWSIARFGADWTRYPMYRVPPSFQNAAETFFRPAFSIDRRMRPAFWSETKPYRGGLSPE